MKFLFDLFPVLLFFVAYQFAGIYVATGVAIVATIAQLIWAKLRTGRIEPMLWLSFVLVVGFGGATLLLHNKTFIQWKPTVLYWSLGGTLLASARFFGKNLIQAAMDTHLRLETRRWARLNLAWSLFFLAMGCLNLWVAYNVPEATWVKFKLFGATGITLVFVLVQAVWLGRHVKDEADGQAN